MPAAAATPDRDAGPGRRSRTAAAYAGEPATASPYAAITRTLTPELPENPTTDQLHAWVELAELSQCPDFRSVLRSMAEDHAADRTPRDDHPTDPTDPTEPTGPSDPTDPAATGAATPASAATPERDLVATVRDRVPPVLAAGVAPASPAADPVITALTAHYARTGNRRGHHGHGHSDLRRQLLTRLETSNDPRRERYLELLSVINGWSPPESLTPALTWTVQALRARTTSG
ncbi:hypothetical protein [Streptomyces sp. CT34]|uniref:hypothetical protein n=1 Tax=Streptomyces sp. CT34 TaxID=1553907 RepID=UPI00068F9A81|nr:hypothetical protein [Streptomyces sp. CT34]